MPKGQTRRRCARWCRAVGLASAFVVGGASGCDLVFPYATQPGSAPDAAPPDAALRDLGAGPDEGPLPHPGVRVTDPGIVLSTSDAPEAVAAGEHVVVLWSEYRSGGGGPWLMARLFSAAGQPAGGATELGLFTKQLKRFRVFFVPGLGLVLFFDADRPGDIAHAVVRIDATTEALSPAFREPISVSAGADSWDVVLDSEGAGGALGYSLYDPAESQARLHVWPLDSEGQPAGTPTRGPVCKYGTSKQRLVGAPGKRVAGVLYDDSTRKLAFTPITVDPDGGVDFGTTEVVVSAYAVREALEVVRVAEDALIASWRAADQRVFLLLDAGGGSRWPEPRALLDLRAWDRDRTDMASGAGGLGLVWHSFVGALRQVSFAEFLPADAPPASVAGEIVTDVRYEHCCGRLVPRPGGGYGILYSARLTGGDALYYEVLR